MAHQDQNWPFFSLEWENQGFVFANYIFLSCSLGSWDTDLPSCMRLSMWLIHHYFSSAVACSWVYQKISTSNFHHSWCVVLCRIWVYRHAAWHKNNIWWLFYAFVLIIPCFKGGRRIFKYSFTLSDRSLHRIKIQTPRLVYQYLYVTS